MGVLCCVIFNLLYKLSDYSVVGTAFGPSLTVGLLAIGPDVSQMLFLPGHQHRSTEVSAQVAAIMDLALCGHYGGSSDSGLAPPPCLSAHKIHSC